MAESRWAYGRLDGKEVGGEYSVMLGVDEADTRSLAADEARFAWDDGVAPPVMVLYELRAVAIGTARLVPGADLGDGDKEPDEWDGMAWDDLRGETL